MAATTVERTTLEYGDGRGVKLVPVKMAGNVKIIKGTIVCLAAGFATPGAVATGLKCIGKATETVDNTGGAAGAKTVLVEAGTFQWNNGTAGDALADADVGATVFVLDNQTMVKTNPGGNTRSAGGVLIALDAAGPWVQTVW